jgi:hypothetical protein
MAGQRQPLERLCAPRRLQLDDLYQPVGWVLTRFGGFPSGANPDSPWKMRRFGTSTPVYPRLPFLRSTASRSWRLQSR